ncbi:MAG: hypothetical protein Q4P15_10685 [Propionibacteriaceae bacterium]|nr:hypothetical protein [Propionibacteriaceae bacterium]
MLTQHLYPSGITAHVVNTDARWHTYWPLVAMILIPVIILAYRRGSVAKN